MNVPTKQANTQKKEASMKNITARGPNFVYAKEFVTQEYGDDIWEKLLDVMPEAEADVWKRPHLITEEYPFSAFKAMVSALSDLVGAMTSEQTAKLYEYIADRSLNTVYKVFLRLAHPATVLKNYPRLWKRFFTSGAVAVPIAKKGHAILRFTLPEIFLDWLPAACYGYSKKAIEMSGGTDVTIQEEARIKEKNGWWNISFELFWQE
jgi:hypothetical protein